MSQGVEPGSGTREWNQGVEPWPVPTTFGFVSRLRLNEIDSPFSVFGLTDYSDT